MKSKIYEKFPQNIISALKVWTNSLKSIMFKKCQIKV